LEGGGNLAFVAATVTETRAKNSGGISFIDMRLTQRGAKILPTFGQKE
jgi:hypothetical protein